MLHQTEITLRNDLSEIEGLIDRVQEFLSAHAVPEGVATKVAMILEELFTNSVSYGFRDDDDHDVRITLKIDSGSMSIGYEDDGVPYDPFARDDPDLDAPVEDRKVGGLGIYLTKVIMDHVSYARVGDRNKILMVKRFADTAS